MENVTSVPVVFHEVGSRCVSVMGYTERVRTGRNILQGNKAKESRNVQ